MTTYSDLGNGESPGATIDDLVNDVQLAGGQYVLAPATLADGKRRVLRLTATGELVVSITSSTAGDATAANQSTEITRLTSILAALPTALAANGGLKIEGVAGGVAIPISSTTLATEATLAAQSAKLPSSVGAKTGALSLSVVPNTDTAFPVTDNGGSFTIDSPQLPAALGPKAPSASLSVVQTGYQYETVATSQTAQALGATGAIGDYLSHVIIQPTTTAAGTCTILDGAIVIFTFTSGTLGDLRPIIVPIGAFSVSGAWKITTGANETAIGIGNFT